MSDNEEAKYAEEHSTQTAQEALTEVVGLLRKHKLVESIVHRQEMPQHEQMEKLVHEQHMAILQKRLAELHPADVANILEALRPHLPEVQILEEEGPYF